MTVKVRFVTADDPMSWMIRGAEMGFLFSHAEVVMPDGTIIGAHASGGVEARPEGYDAVYKPIEQIILVPATDAQTAACHDFLLAQLHKGYDIGAIAALACREAWPSEHSILCDGVAPWIADQTKWFCSELVEAALEVASIVPPLPMTPRRVTPRDLFFRLSLFSSNSLPTPTSTPQALEMEARPV